MVLGQFVSAIKVCLIITWYMTIKQLTWSSAGLWLWVCVESLPSKHMPTVSLSQVLLCIPYTLPPLWFLISFTWPYVRNYVCRRWQISMKGHQVGAHPNTRWKSRVVKKHLELFWWNQRLMTSEMNTRTPSSLTFSYCRFLQSLHNIIHWPKY